MSLKISWSYCQNYPCCQSHISGSFSLCNYPSISHILFSSLTHIPPCLNSLLHSYSPSCPSIAHLFSEPKSLNTPPHLLSHLPLPLASSKSPMEIFLLRFVHFPRIRHRHSHLLINSTPFLFIIFSRRLSWFHRAHPSRNRSPHAFFM
jgi:hypothetical protein